jgi:Copper transport outer membrane protein, MctB
VINFRYHVVSLTAVFLALAIGLVVGTAALNGPLETALQNNVSSLSKQSQTYRDQITQLEAEAGRQEQFADQAGPIMLAGKLTGRHVLVVSLAQAGASVAKVVEKLKLAGAQVTGQLEIEDKLLDPTNKADLLDVANNAAQQPGITGTPLNSNGVETSSFLLATVLLAHKPALSADVPKIVVTAYKESNFIVPTGDLSTPAEAVVLVSGGPYTDSNGEAKNANVVTIVDQFSRIAPTVVAANGAGGAGNVIAAVRSDPKLSKTAATVDNVNTPDGQVAVPLALGELLTTNKPGHYGVAGGASSMLPKIQS